MDSKMPELAPVYVSPDVRITGRSRVFVDPKKTDPTDPFFVVDLATWTCECEHGSALIHYDRTDTWKIRYPCNHKVRAFATLVEAHNCAPDMLWLYIKSLGARYNVYECVSVFHKELRRGDFNKAFYWGMMLATKRGGKGVMKYLLNTTYEETRDHQLAEWLLTHQVDPSMQTVALSIELYCAAPKKWFLPVRYNIYMAEMAAYNKLADEFSDDIGKGGDIIPWEPHHDRLHSLMMAGADTQNLEEMQFGLKGLQKSADVDRTELRAWIASELLSIGRKNGIEGVEQLHDFITRRRHIMGDIRYHEINMLADCVAGEPYGAGLTSPAVRKRIIRRPHERNFPLGVAPYIPLYAQDNHTWAGKRLLKRFPAQTLPSAKQTDIDLRWCGAYMGVGFRMLSVEQHGSVVEWEKVKWPKKLYESVNRLWY